MAAMATSRTVVASLKVRVTSGCFHREHSPKGYALIDEALAATPNDPRVELVEHESGPELLVELAVATAGLSFANSVIDLVVAIIKARGEGIRRGDRPDEPVELIVRRFDGSVEEETILRIGAGEALDQDEVRRRLAEAARRMVSSASSEDDRG